jgi:hypothetical protein
MTIPLSSVEAGGMEILARQIRRELELKTQAMGHCAIYEDKLQRIWPLDEKDRERKIAQFAREHGFYLSFYRQGLCAIFVKESQIVFSSGNQKRF